MKPTPFTLEQLFYPEISVKSNKSFDYESDLEETSPQIKIFVNRTDGDVFHVGLELSLPSESSSDKYEISALAIGVFTCDDNLSDQEKISLIGRNGPNIVYGGLRDMIATITGRGPWNEYYLQPSVIEPSDFAKSSPVDINSIF